MNIGIDIMVSDTVKDMSLPCQSRQVVFATSSQYF